MYSKVVVLPLDVVPTCVQPVVPLALCLDHVAGGTAGAGPGEIDLGVETARRGQAGRGGRGDRDPRLGGRESRRRVSVTVTDCVPAVPNVTENDMHPLIGGA